jgi:hypothetical protein
MSAGIAGNIKTDGAVAPSQLFVINLCASTSPMALAHPSAPELKRYTFFVSRQREDGRERFRLHMGYFDSQEAAEKLLEAVRDVYPAAWAGLAPTSGAPRRNRAATMPAVTAAVASAATAPVVTAAPVVAVAPVAAAVPAMTAPKVPAAAPAAVEVAAPAAAAAPVKPVQVIEPPPPMLDAMSNVRAVIAELSESHVPRLQPAPRAAAADLNDAQVLQVLEAPAAAAAPPPAARKTPPPAPAAQPATGAESEGEVRVVTPEDTQTLTDIRIDAQNNAPPCFAVQLVWSVSPIDVASLPHLAIFDAYTLYNVEGSRQGRKWFGLRLGFFSDPNSATQVANYVRSDYRSVAIVPVAIKERDRAGGGAVIEKGKSAPRLGEPQKPDAQAALSTEDLQGFELLADDRPAPRKLDLDDKPAAAEKAGAQVAGKTAAPVLKPAPPKATGRPTGKRVMVRKRPDAPLRRAAPGAPTPLESTLEILGASTLTLDESREIINDSAVRKPVDRKSAGGNRFSKLLSRLSGN